MGWFIMALAVVWLIPPVAAAAAAIGYLFSHAFRTWLGRVLFGDSLPATPRATVPIRRAAPVVRRG